MNTETRVITITIKQDVNAEGYCHDTTNLSEIVGSILIEQLEKQSQVSIMAIECKRVDGNESDYDLAVRQPGRERGDTTALRSIYARDM